MSTKPEYIEIAYTGDNAIDEPEPDSVFYLAPEFLRWILEGQGLCEGCAQKLSEQLKSAPFHNSYEQNKEDT